MKYETGDQPMIRKRVYPEEPLPLSVQRFMAREIEKLTARPIETAVMKQIGEMKPKSGRPPSGKKVVSLRLDIDVIEKFKATGPGWQARINEALRKA
jgi:uncharacterized protein (DUF4415 family)